MLLTSSQVSVAVSSGVVVIFTSALFLSGYAIQQRTLRTLRAAIREPPRPSPKLFLPDRFVKDTTELEDGTVVVIESGDGYGGEEQVMMSKNRGRGKAKRTKRRWVDGDEDLGGEVFIEVRPTIADDEANGSPEHEDEEGGNGVQEAEVEQESDAASAPAPEGAALESEPRPQSHSWWQPWKARSSADNTHAATDATAADADTEGKDKTTKPISRAERRRRIKEEIQRLAQGDTPIYYQRRLY